MEFPSLRRLQNIVVRSSTAVHVSTLLSGTVLSQLVLFIATGIMSRLYSTTEIGSFQAFMTIPQTIAVLAGLRYDMAIVFPERDANARRLVRVVLCIATVSSVLTSLMTWAAAPTIAGWMHHPELEHWLAWSGVLVWVTAIVNIMGYWCTRLTRYGVISTNRVLQSATTAAGQIAAGAIGHGGIGGQMFGQVLGQGVAAAIMVWRGRAALRGSVSDAMPARDLLRRYRRMPLLNGPNVLVDAVRTSGILLLVGICYTPDLQGQFSQAWRLMQAPVVLITGAVSQVFLQKFSTTPRGQMRALVDRSVRVSLLAGVVPFALLAVMSPWLFPWYLGASQWAESGHVAQTLVPWLYLSLATSPISTVYVVTDRQGYMLAFACVYAAAPLALIVGLSSVGVALVPTLWAVSAMMSVLLAGLVLLTRRVASRWDAEGSPETESANRA
ncbi:MAG: oligosaccharide flippase family protein [Actinomyces sp.]|nr:oligosaccharide flippase family protein [Actinomyces sp.]MCI1829630.1 oligosaccharide flippase family protein [Actinomyces sp.]